MSDALSAEGTSRCGRAEPFEAFFTRTFTGMFARALLLCGHRQDAEDAVQEAYAQAYRRWERLSGYDAPDAWVYRVVRQRLWATRRRNARTHSAGAGPAGLESPAATGVEETAEARSVLAALALLPRRQRTVLVLHCLHGLSQEAVAEELGLSRGGVAASLFKARRRLEKMLDLRERTSVGPRGGRDGLVASGTRGPRVVLAGPATRAEPSGRGRVGAALAVAEEWLRRCVAAEPRVAARVRDALAAGAGQGGDGRGGPE
ncbi:RNA polymerase sigma factor [Streptomyces sp. GSL17-111]|uniref:RNA polymerase sigma factor n=1 Tax=Streptomyces sp. GSL17-111 TaxID=3121596 RepID=UPI0030F44D9B